MELLLPYANDINGNLIHINNAQKGQKYTCPTCGKEVLLKISKIPEWQKYHKRNHFAHKIKIDSENRCSESFLHKRFKEKCSELISTKIKEKQELFFVWKCIECNQVQKDNLLSGVGNVITEYNLEVCRPDIALLDSEGKLLIVVEIVVSHSPEEKSLKYYEGNNIFCLKVKVSNFEECDEIEKVLKDADKVEIYPQRECVNCLEKVKKVSQRENSGCSADFPEEDLPVASRLKEQADKLVCKKCDGKMKIVQDESGLKFLRCRNHPKCNFRFTIDTLIWPEDFPYE